MKRLLSIILILVMMLGTTAPAFAATTQSQVIEFYDQSTHTATNAKTWADSVLTQISSVATRVYNCYTRLGTIANALTDNSNSYLLTNLLLQVQKLTHIADQIDLFLGSDGTTTITENWSEFTADMYKLVRFLAPVSGSLPGSGNNFMTLWDYTFFVAGRVADLWGGWDAYFSELPGIHSDASTIRTNVSYLPYALANYYRETETLSPTMRKINAHYTLVNEDGSYSLVGLNDDGTFRTYNVNWKNGSPLGNIALINRTGNGAMIQALSRLVAYYNDTLTTWEHDDLTQTEFTPKSLGNGLYRYLAYVQSDTANLDYNFNHALTNIHRGQSTLNVLERQTNSHSYLIGSDGTYTLSYYNASGIESTPATITWQNGTPIGNLATIMRYSVQQTNKLLSFVVGSFDQNISTYNWESADSTKQDLAAVSDTPTSFADGVYSLLQNIQKPLARLTYVHADDHAIEAKAYAEQTGITEYESSIYDPNDSNSVKVNDFSSALSTVGTSRNKFNTGVSFSTNGLFSFTDDGNWGFWSEAVKNDMDTVPEVRKFESYDSSAYDEQLEELYSIWGIKNDK